MLRTGASWPAKPNISAAAYQKEQSWDLGPAKLTNDTTKQNQYALEEHSGIMSLPYIIHSVQEKIQNY